MPTKTEPPPTPAPPNKRAPRTWEAVKRDVLRGRFRYARVSTDEQVQARYEYSRDQGTSEKLALMLAERSPPGANGSDAAFAKGFHGLAQFDRMPAPMAEQYLSRAKKAGIQTHGKAYLPELARRGMGGGVDPLAWVPCGDGMRAHVKRVCELTNRDCQGMVSHDAVETPPAAPIPLAEDLVRRKMRDYVNQDPKKEKDLRGLREEVIAKHAPARRRKQEGKGARV